MENDEPSSFTRIATIACGVMFTLCLFMLGFIGYFVKSEFSSAREFREHQTERWGDQTIVNVETTQALKNLNSKTENRYDNVVAKATNDAFDLRISAVERTLSNRTEAIEDVHSLKQSISLLHAYLDYNAKQGGVREPPDLLFGN